MTLSFVGYIAAQLLALGMMLQMLLGWSLPLCMLMALGIVLFYTTSGACWLCLLPIFSKA